MSTCISSHGEYSEHDPGDWCPLCGAFNDVRRWRIRVRSADRHPVRGAPVTRLLLAALLALALWPLIVLWGMRDVEVGYLP